MALTPLKTGRLDETLRSAIKEGNQAWGKYLAGHLEVGGRAARGGRRRREKAAGVGRRDGEDIADKQGPLDRETRERWPAREGANQKGKRISRERRDRRAGWMGRPGWFRPAGTARPVGGLGQRPSGPQGWPGQKQGKKNFRIKIGFLNLPRLWKFVEGDLGGILT
jgi:hypothetical protein